MVRKYIWIAVAALLVRALIPVGYMPGNLLAGEYMVLCSFQWAAPSAHAHHDHTTETPEEAHEACPIGQAVQQAALPLVARIAIEPPAIHGGVETLTSVGHVGTSPRSIPIRGPP